MMKRYILVIGTDVIMPKLFYFKDLFSRKNVYYAVYTHDHSIEGRLFAERNFATVLYGPVHKRSVITLIRNWLTLYKRINELNGNGNRIVHVEFFLNWNSIILLGYLYIVLFKKIRVVAWFRGELYEWSSRSNIFDRLFARKLIKNARAVILKELYMEKVLEEHNMLSKEKIFHIHNTVDLAEYRPKTIEKSTKVNLLFLNMFKPWRNVNFIVKVAQSLKSLGSDFHIEVVGDKTKHNTLVEEANQLKTLVKENQMEDYITVHEFSSNPTDFYEKAHFFLLPSNLIFCNYSLLEAMSHGVVPIVYNVDAHYRKIIEDGVSGYGLGLDPKIWAETIMRLANTPECYSKMSRNARKRIEGRFNIGLMFSKYYDILETRVWR